MCREKFTNWLNFSNMVFAVFCEKAVKWLEKWKNRPRLGRFCKCVRRVKGRIARLRTRLGVVLVETRNEIRVSKRGFRTLRSPTQGAALRTRKPFEKGLSESFISPAGGMTAML